MTYFNELIKLIERGQYLFINFDLSGVKKATNCAVLYLFSIVHSLEAKGEHPRCIPPNDRGTESTLQESNCLPLTGFTEQVTKHLISDNILINMGNQFTPDDLKQVVEFIRKRTTKCDVGFLYELIGELMQNTMDHAYKGRHRDQKHVEKSGICILFYTGKKQSLHF